MRKEIAEELHMLRAYQLAVIRAAQEERETDDSEQQTGINTAENGEHSSELARVKAEEEAKKKTEEAHAFHQARLEAEEARRLAEIARVTAEEAARKRVQEIEAEREARLLAEQQARRKTEQVQKHTQQELLMVGEEPDRKALRRACPTCKREFSVSEVYCLYDATPLLAPGAKPANNTSGITISVWLLVIVALVAIALGAAVLTDFPRQLVLAMFADGTKSNTNVDNLTDDHPVASGALAGKELSLPNAEYPSTVNRKSISGKVTVSVLVDRTGAVTKAWAMDGHPFLQRAAVAAAKKAKFSQSKLIDQTGLTSGTITYTFK